MTPSSEPRDHGGNLHAAADHWGGPVSDWIDLSTGINPVPYPMPDIPGDDWTRLPDPTLQDRLIAAARDFWQVPATLDILPAPGASALIAAVPGLVPAGAVEIPAPTYNEHAAAFGSAGFNPGEGDDAVLVVVNPNNPDGRIWRQTDLPENRPLTVIDESFCDVVPDASLLGRAETTDAVILKSFGKFWGLAGLRLGFAIARPDLIARLKERIGPWAVSGPALTVGTSALSDHHWAQETRSRLHDLANRLDRLAADTGFGLVGGTSLFRLYEAANAKAVQDTLAEHRIWSRIFPYSKTWIRLGLPGGEHDWGRVAKALTAR